MHKFAKSFSQRTIVFIRTGEENAFEPFSPDDFKNDFNLINHFQSSAENRKWKYGSMVC